MFPDFINESIIQQYFSTTGIVAKYFDKTIERTSSAQACDDIIFFMLSQIIGMDFKTRGQIGADINVIMPPMTQEQYMKFYKNELMKKDLKHLDVLRGHLNKFMENPSFETWTKYSPDFPNNFKPPFILNHVIDSNTLTSVEKENFKQASYLISALSKGLYAKKASPPINGKPPENFIKPGQELYREVYKRIIGGEFPEM